MAPGAGGRHLSWSNRALAGSLLVGWGLFNLVEGLVDHQWLGVRHVNEQVDRAHWLAWDLGFLAILLGGVWLLRTGRRQAGAAPAALWR
ncbi:hypothetical protein Y590_20713 [Methylobacterium sp. AMS5]|nr:hypothetical protein Y590_20713 [Methylobacterium sp. AMS5]